MKVTKEAQAKMKELIAPLDTEARRESYRTILRESPSVKDANKRYRWDLLWASRAHPGYDNGVTDVHVDTALRSIVPPL